ncbi:hypothetical protein [Gaopeijia maritima]|uniref:Uncharacterized protein n=1 Tax=Gaopeijia maritima TaxID=3119007 RepID=A0ABU9EBF4_9BACT
MNEELLTAFQRDVEADIRRMLARHGRSAVDRDVYEGLVPFYSSQVQRYVKLRIDGIEVWLFESEANFSGPTGGGEFERADYSSEAELKMAFLEALFSHL